MGYLCAVCEPKDPTALTYHFPKKRRQEWEAQVPIKDFKSNEHSVLCEKHFEANDFAPEDEKSAGDKTHRRRLKRDALPRLWPGFPGYISKPTPKPRGTKLSSSAAREEKQAINSSEVEINKDVITSLNELETKFNTMPDGLLRIINEDHHVYLEINHEEMPAVAYCVKVQSTMKLEMWCKGESVEMKKLYFSGQTPHKLTKISSLVDILDQLKTMAARKVPKTDEEIIHYVVEILSSERFVGNIKAEFCAEQLSLGILQPKGRRYSPPLLALAVQWQQTSPALYNLILSSEVVCLPSVRWVLRLSSALNMDFELTESTIAYLKARILKLEKKDLTANLIIDEVHSHHTVDLVSGKIIGLDVDGEITKTLFTVMIKSIAGKYRDVISMTPINRLNADKLVKIWNNVIKAVTAIRFDVVVTTVDGMRTNISFYNKLAVPSSRSANQLYAINPAALSRSIFLTFDSVHLFKNFYNNFCNYRELHFPEFPIKTNGCTVTLIANFSDIEKLYELELRKPEKIAHKLSRKMLYPNSIEKTNAKLADACFHESTITGLLYYAENGYPRFQETATFLKIIRQWFNVMNVKSKFDAKKTKDETRKCVSIEYREQLNYLGQFYSWLDLWEATQTKGFSSLTFHSAKVTCANFIQMTNYVLDDDTNGIQYITFGSVSQDALGGRFGNWRQLFGGDYYNGAARFLQAEKKIRLSSLIKMGFTMPEIKDIFKSVGTSDGVREKVTEILGEISNFSFHDNSMITSVDEMTVYYTAGSIVRGLKKQLKCTSCQDMLVQNSDTLSFEDQIQAASDSERTKLVDLVNRGGLHKPSDIVHLSCVYAWNLYKFIQSDEQLLKKMMLGSNARSVFTGVYMRCMSENESTVKIYNHKCTFGCPFQEKLGKIAMATFNIKAKNFVREEKDKIHEAKSKNRKHVSNVKESGIARKIKKVTG